MATEIKTWEIVQDSLTPISSSLAENGRQERQHLEEWIKTKPEILGSDILIIGEQVDTKSGQLDFLGIDNNGNLVIVELKRDKIPRKTLAQAIDYASDLSNWDIDKISEECIKFTGNNLEEALTKHFEDVEIEELTINQNQRLLLVGFAVEESLSRMIEWLSDSFDVGINAIILNYSKTANGSELLSRTVTIPEEVEKEKTNKRKFKIKMSDEAGQYEDEKLKELLKKYFSGSRKSANRIKNVLLPALLEHETLTRNQLKKEFVETGEAPDENQAGYRIALISKQLGNAKKDYLRQIINYEYPNPNKDWKKDNFSLRDEYKEFTKRLLDELNSKKAT